MGYYVRIIDAEFLIPTKNFGKAYKAMCELNAYDDLKRGGSYGGEGKREAWFSWMDANYPETCADAEAILRQIGFEVGVIDDGLVIYGFESKQGQEDLFLEACAPYVKTGSFIVWQGEEDEDLSRWLFDGKTMTTQYATITVSWPEGEA